jgi:hypothetical protein
MGPEAWIAVVALLVSVFTLVWTVRAQRSQAEQASLQANMASLVELWGTLGRKPSILRFHGVSEADLATAGVDHEELAYLIASFEAASVYYRYFERGEEPFPEGSLRHKMCASDATRNAWPLLRRFFTGDPAYLAKIEATISLFHKPQLRP